MLNILVVKEIMPNFVRSFGHTITTSRQFGYINNSLNNLRYEENFYIINRGYISHRHLLGSREDDSVAKHWRECERDFNGICKSSDSKGIWNFGFLYS